jgi:hypothetical protein
MSRSTTVSPPPSMRTVLGAAWTVLLMCVSPAGAMDPDRQP